MKKLLIRFSRWLSPVSEKEVADFLVARAEALKKEMNVNAASVGVTGWSGIPVNGLDDVPPRPKFEVSIFSPGCVFGQSSHSIQNAIGKVKP